MHFRPRRASLLSLLTCGLLALSPGLAGAATTPIGSAPRLPEGATTVGSVASDHRLELTVALAPRDPAALQAYAEEVSTPGSPVYGQYLSVAEFTSRFGPTRSAVDTVRSALVARGLEVGEVAANRLSLPVTATAVEAEAAFATSLDRVRLSSGEFTYANVTAPSVPSAAAPYVQAILGLAELGRSHPAIAPSAADEDAPDYSPDPPTANGGPFTGGPQPCAEANAARHEEGFNGYTGDQLAAAYGFTDFYSAGNFGAGETVALYEEYHFRPKDIEVFQRCYGTDVPVEAVDAKGEPAHGAGEGEAMLDIEQIIQLAPGARIRVYQGSGDTTVDIISRWVNENTAKVMSDSYGDCEAVTEAGEESAVNTLLQEAAVQGQSFFVAAGDYGSSDCEQEGEPNPQINVDYPGTDPFATDVGGTRMEQPTAPRPVEYLWNDSPSWGAGGGGVSEDFPMPAYQANAAADTGVVGRLSSGEPCKATAGYCRQVPDVSADASQETGYVIYYDGQWEVNGGTSAAAPLWAALATLINASPACGGHRIGFLNPALYQLAGSDYETNFRDIVEAKPGGKPTTSRQEESLPFPAGPGYDMATGLGTPIGGSLGASLCTFANPPAPPTPPSPPAPTPSTSTSSTQGAPAPAPAPQPRLVGARLGGVAKGRPHIRLRLEAREGSSLESLTLTLPGDLPVTSDPGDLAAGVVVREQGGRRLRLHTQAHGRTLRIGLATPSPALSLTVRFPALTVSPKLLAQARRGADRRLALALTAGESAGQSSRFPIALYP